MKISEYSTCIEFKTKCLGEMVLLHFNCDASQTINNYLMYLPTFYKTFYEFLAFSGRRHAPLAVPLGMWCK